MRALLVNPWIHDFKAFDFWNKPLGLMTVSSILKKYGLQVDLIDCMDRASPYFKTPTRTDGFGRGKYVAEEVEKPMLFKKIPRRYKRYGLQLHSSNGLHCRYIDPDIAGLIHRAGFKTIYLSLETTNPQAQKATGGKVFTDEFTRAVDILNETGFPRKDIRAYLLFGLPGQKPEEILEAKRFCQGAGIDPHLCEFSPIPHTAEYEKTGFNDATDPLYHNNFFYTWHVAHPDPAIYQKFKTLLKNG